MTHDMSVSTRTNLSWSLACLGHLDQALFQGGAALDEARRLSHPATLALALGPAVLMTGWLVRRESRALLEYADETLTLASQHGLNFYRAMALLWRGWCLAALGCASEGIRILVAGTADLEAIGFRPWTPWRLVLVGDAYRMGGQLQTALEHLAAARRWAEETGERWLDAEALRGSGDVLLEMGDPTDAEACYCDALRIARQQRAKLWELRAAISLAQLWRDQDKRGDARNLLGPVYGWFTEGFDTPVLKEAKALLDELAAERGAELAGPMRRRLPGGGAARHRRSRPLHRQPQDGVARRRTTADASPAVSPPQANTETALDAG
jgi:predicted ATPase